MHKPSVNGNFCYNDGDTWDAGCNNSVQAGFGGEYACQNVRAGEYARLLVKDAQGCNADGDDVGATIDGDMDTFAQCYPSLVHTVSLGQ